MTWRGQSCQKYNISCICGGPEKTKNTPNCQKHGERLFNGQICLSIQR